jgi:hypothetical protein
MVAQVLFEHGGAPAPLREALTFSERGGAVHVKRAPAT